MFWPWHTEDLETSFLGFTLSPTFPHPSPPFPPPSPLIINAKRLYKHSWNPNKAPNVGAQSELVAGVQTCCSVQSELCSGVESESLSQWNRDGWSWNRRDWDIWDWASSRNTAPLESVKHLVAWQQRLYMLRSEHERPYPTSWLSLLSEKWTRTLEPQTTRKIGAFPIRKCHASDEAVGSGHFSSEDCL